MRKILKKLALWLAGLITGLPYTDKRSRIVDRLVKWAEDD